MPKYLCRTPDDDDEYARPFDATTPVDAACKFAEYHDQTTAEYPGEQEVVVISPDGSRVTLTVLMAMVPEYWCPRKRPGPGN